MAGSTLSFRAATPADTHAIGLVGSKAFRDTLSTVIFPARLRTSSEGVVTPWRAARTLRRMNEGKPTFVAVDTNLDTKEETIVGFAQWEQPGEATSGQEGEHDEDKATDALDGEALARMMGAMEAEAKKQLGPDGHARMWYLAVLAIDPEHERRGIGRTLVRWGLEQAAAEEDGKVFLIATAEGKPLYEALGFRVLGEFDAAGLRHYSMLWTSDVSN
ncbi:puromycin N-acetyltransferase [Podospora aff. communis PSN243]|uniref:Puromycin N-acetyltransferase n=1 Tax=Podospora aff. communis PSN243 TaxID=3040156 RepID=A0AAV9G7G8_9PEZI|nr:puromycin N-acetyltransferase [Podospora aff. communis PSN243]